MKDVKILLTIDITFEKIISKQSICISDRTTNMQFSKTKLTRHWLRHSTAPNVPALFTQSSQAKNLVFIFLLQP